MPRLVLSLAALTAGGDWANSYYPLAENILRNGCVSLSPALSGECVPSWGGNQLPGYSAFAAALWSLTGESWAVLAVAQSIVVAGAIVVVAMSAERMANSRLAGLLVGAVLALSPQHLAWARFLSTDTLTVAFSITIMAILLHALARRRLPVWPIALVMVGALAVRFDLILLAVPIAAVAFVLHAPAQAVGRGLLIALIVLIPAGLWAARNVAAGLPTLPTHFFSPKFPMPEGFVRWGYSWTTIEYQYPDWYNPAVSGHYDQIRIDPAVYVSAEERRAVEDLLGRLQVSTGQAIPDEIDSAFARLAHERYATYPVRHWLVYPALRVVHMWFNPLNSTAWPVDVDRAAIAAAEAERTPAGLLALAWSNPVSAMVKVGAGLHRLALLALAGWLLWYSLSRQAHGPWRALLWAAWAHAVVRTLFFAYFPLVETRYIMPVTPWLEVAVALGLLARFWPQAAPGLLAVRPPFRGS